MSLVCRRRHPAILPHFRRRPQVCFLQSRQTPLTCQRLIASLGQDISGAEPSSLAPAMSPPSGPRRSSLASNSLLARVDNGSRHLPGRGKQTDTRHPALVARPAAPLPKGSSESMLPGTTGTCPLSGLLSSAPGLLESPVQTP